ncbi:MAG: HesA/MoeB/ThiF family protein [Candidatus Sulfotelmatobacter sp.]
MEPEPRQLGELRRHDSSSLRGKAMKGLVFCDEDLSNVRHALLAAAPQEAAALLLAGRAGSGAQTRLLVREHFVVPADAYQTQETLRAVIDPSFIMPLLKRARRERLSLVLTHTHPFAENAHFSTVDDEGERVLMPAFFSRTGDCPHGALVLTASDCSARIWTQPKAEPTHLSPVTEVGRNLRIHDRSRVLSPTISKQFDRSVRAFGAEGQATLASFSIGIIGLGGIGSVVAEQLAHLGVGRLLLLDPDVLEETNLNRVVGATRNNIGRPKVEVASELIRRINPQIQVTAILGNVILSDDARRVLSSDFLFSCTDSHGSRAVINQLAYQYVVPTIDLGVRIQVRAGTVESITGRVQMLAPGLPCLVCQNLLDPEEVRRDLLSDEARARDPYIVGAVEAQPAVISLNSTVASLGVTMMLSAVVGLPVPARHQLVLFNRGVVRIAGSDPLPECVVCSLKGMLARGDTWPMAGRPS